jgi:hypothetical protein
MPQPQGFYRFFLPQHLGIFMPEECLSKKHAVLFLEDEGQYCAVKDLGSVNKVRMTGPCPYLSAPRQSE